MSVSKLEIAQELMPTDVKEILKKEGIDLNKIPDLSTKNLSKGTLIEVHTGKDKIVIDVE